MIARLWVSQLIYAIADSLIHRKVISRFCTLGLASIMFTIHFKARGAKINSLSQLIVRGVEDND